mmetsp:Transcript_74089/g.117312  ORF Transcript_74089/g.117312 Transcript_74089/m.117312 type:complete len:201 (+) Transcript_74089:142-744(+)
MSPALPPVVFHRPPCRPRPRLLRVSATSADSSPPGLPSSPRVASSLFCFFPLPPLPEPRLLPSTPPSSSTVALSTSASLPPPRPRLLPFDAPFPLVRVPPPFGYLQPPALPQPRSSPHQASWLCQESHQASEPELPQAAEDHHVSLAASCGFDSTNSWAPPRPLLPLPLPPFVLLLPASSPSATPCPFSASLRDAFFEEF